jgi:flagellar hook-associated protein 2
MVSSVNFGAFTEIGGQRVTSGIASGLDTEALIKALVDARSIPATQLEDRITALGTKMDTLDELRTKLQAFQDAAELLSNPDGINNAVNNIFEYRNVFLSSSSSTLTSSDYLGVVAEPGADLGDYTIEIDNLAERQLNRSVAQTSKTADLVNGATTFQIRNTALTVLATVNLNDNDSLQEIATKINAVTDLTGVRASILQVADNDFRLVLEAQETGTDAAFNLNFTADPGGLAAQLNFSTIQAAENASLTVNGIAGIARQSNVIDDIVNGVTFSLFQETPTGAPDTTITAQIIEDQELVIQAVQNFVTTYNDFKTFAAEQQERNDDGTFTDTAILQNNLTLSAALTRAQLELNRIVGGITAGDPEKLSDIGLSFTDQSATSDQIAVNHILSFDQTTFANVLNTDFEGVRKVFEFQFTPDSGDLALFSHTNELSTNVTSMTVDVDYTTVLEESTGNDITAAPIFGAATSAAVFTTLTDGVDSFDITLTTSGGTSATYTFTYAAAPGAQEFNSLDTLATSIDAISGLQASVVNNRLVILSSSSQNTLSFANNGGTADFVTDVGLTNTTIPTDPTVVEITYDDGTGSTTDAADFTPSTARSVGNDITDADIFGAGLSTEVFSTLANGDAFRVTITTVLGGVVTYDFTFQDTNPATSTGQFNSLSTLATALNAKAELSASVQDNKLSISPEFAYDTLTFTNLGAPDFITDIGLQDTTIIGGTITTQDDTSIAGMVMVYSGSSSGSVDVTINHGIASRVYNTMAEITEDETGILDIDREGMSDTQDTMNDTLERMQLQIENFRQTLIAQFSALEDAVSRVNSILQFLNAQSQAQLVNANN